MSSITNIDATDLITDSRADINNNFANLNADKMETSVLDTDTTLAADSDSKVATQKAVKAYVDAGGNVNATETTKGIVEIATAAEVAAGTDIGGTGATLVVKPSQIGRTQQVTFTADGTWTKDTGLVRVEVEAWGGGGSGGSWSASFGATGGGGGGYFKKTFEASELGATETVTIGAGGVGVSGDTAGNDGANTTFGSLLTAYLGKGGVGTASSGAGGDGGDIQSGSTTFRGAGGNASGATAGVGVYWGGGGGGGTDGSTNAVPGGSSLWGGGGGGAAEVSFGQSEPGGTSLYGGNGGAGSYNGSGTAGAQPGGGGGGSVTGTSGAGGDGQVIVTEYYV